MSNLIQFEGHDIDVVSVDSVRYVRGGQIVTPLQTTHGALKKLFKRHRHEFTPDMSITMRLKTPGGPQVVRLFSARGLALICMLLNSEPAARFRAWALDVLEGRKAEPVPPPPLPAPETDLTALKLEARTLLKGLKAGFSQSDMARMMGCSRGKTKILAKSLRSLGLLGAPSHV